MFPIRDHNPSGRRPYVTYALVAINVGVFLAYFPAKTDFLLNYFLYDWGLVPARIMAGEGYETFVTSMFLHASWGHLAGNMLFLWIFGDNLEDGMGHAGFLVFYLLAGVAAGLGQIVPDTGSALPMVGASGAIAGVMGGYLLMFPRAKVDVLFFFVVFFRIFAIRAWIVLGVWFGIQLVFGYTTPADSGGVAYWAHAGGFLAGILLTLPVWLRRGGRSYWRATEGHPPHPETAFPASRSPVPLIRRNR